MWSGLQRVLVTCAARVCDRSAQKRNHMLLPALKVSPPPALYLRLGFDMQLCELSVSLICGQPATDDSEQNTYSSS